MKIIRSQPKKGRSVLAISLAEEIARTQGAISKGETMMEAGRELDALVVEEEAERLKRLRHDPSRLN